MAFEKIALANAEACGIKDAYFVEGTMFCAAEDTVEATDAVAEFQLIYPNTQVSRAGDELAIDFTV